ncbi:hypothetical protein ACFL46_04930 [Candidatus Neomarinimicrobiota bacterium]
MKSVLIMLILFLQGLIISAQEVAVKAIQLSGPVGSPKQEISGLAWLDDNLILLPEVPAGFVFAIPKKELLNQISSDSPIPIKPNKIEFNTPDYRKTIPGFDGFEALATSGSTVYFTIEARYSKQMVGYLIKGEFDKKLNQIIVGANDIIKLIPPVNLKNFTFEALLTFGGIVSPIYEANGPTVNPNPTVQIYSLFLENLGTAAFPELEYRVTDATAVDSRGVFWVINYYWPGDSDILMPGTDILLNDFPKGVSHKNSETVERLIEMQYFQGAINLTGRPPIQLELLPGESRNWEGLVRIDDLGFIIMTDMFPEAILGFVPQPD